MKSVLIMQKLIIVLVAVLFAGAGLGITTQQVEAQPSWIPKPPKAIGGECDADPAWMRKWHMTSLDHKRDQTMREGIRTKKFSLKNCISCHAVKDDNGKYLTIKDERHFCRSCHDYTAVRIDCFDCHASRPGEKMDKAVRLKGNPHGKEEKMSSSSNSKAGTTIAALQKFIAGEDK